VQPAAGLVQTYFGGFDMSHSTRYVVLVHLCPRNRLVSILNSGLSPLLSQGARQVVWLMAPGKVASWGMKHIAAHHGTTTDKLVALRVLVPRKQLQRRRRGIWTCRFPIPARRIQAVKPAVYIEPVTPW
jgi:hypothetical protein